MEPAGASFNGTISSQKPEVLEGFINLLIQEQVRSYLEIGLRIGATFREVGFSLPRKSVLVGIDLPGASGGVDPSDADSAIAELEHTAALLRRRYQHDVLLLWGNSRSSEIIDQARSFSPYDAILIDGDHSWKGVRTDWKMYSSMARLVALHDIDAPRRKRYGVPILWQQLQRRFRHRTIRSSVPGMSMGVIWMRSNA